MPNGKRLDILPAQWRTRMFLDYLTLTLAVINLGTMGYAFFRFELDEEVENWLANAFGLTTLALTLCVIIGALFK